MIESVSRIVTTAASKLPPLFEVPVTSGNFVQTLWMTATPSLGGGTVYLTEVDSGESIDLDPYDLVTWLQPEDMNSISVQAEIITALASKGIEL